MSWMIYLPPPPLPPPPPPPPAEGKLLAGHLPRIGSDSFLLAHRPLPDKTYAVGVVVVFSVLILEHLASE